MDEEVKTKPKRQRRPKYKNGQAVVFKYVNRFLIGNIKFSKSLPKRIEYVIKSENGKTYDNIGADTGGLFEIKTPLTLMYCLKHKLSIEGIPVQLLPEGNTLNISEVESVATT